MKIRRSEGGWVEELKVIWGDNVIGETDERKKRMEGQQEEKKEGRQVQERGMQGAWMAACGRAREGKTSAA